MNSETIKMKPLTKDETKNLLNMIENSKIINNKGTNACTNNLKNEEWRRISDAFNAQNSTCRRTPQQLRLKWENLKKNARKRNTAIRMNNIKTGGGGPDYIPPDDILDRVASLLGSTADGFVVEFGGDAEPQEFVILGTGGESVVEDMPSDARVISPESIENIDTANKDLILGEATLNQPNYTTPKPKLSFGIPRGSGYKRKHNMDASQAAKNTAIAEYFAAKKKLTEAKLENVHLLNEKLKLEIKELKHSNPE